jgi:hypothetical protein
LAANHSVSGSARLTSSLIISLQIGIGVALVYQIGTLFPTQDVPFDYEYPWWMLVVAMTIITIGFFIQMHSPQYPLSALFSFLSSFAGFFCYRYTATLLGDEVVCFQ